MGTETITQRIANLRERRRELPDAPYRIALALARTASLWQTRLDIGWLPPPGSAFPWAMVRRSLAALVVSGSGSGVRGLGSGQGKGIGGESGELGSRLVCDGMNSFAVEPPAVRPTDEGDTNIAPHTDSSPSVGRTAGGSTAKEFIPSHTKRDPQTPEPNTQPLPSRTPDPGPRTPVLALILAGNTPLLAWPALTAALTAGVPVFVKLSRDEGLWTRLFVEALAEVDSEVAALVEMDVWPGEDARTAELVGAADAVVAYGGDATIAALRTLTPPGKPFYGFGHALSIGIATDIGGDAAGPFAGDILMYDQGGCLSPHAVLVRGGAEEARAVGERMAEALAREAAALAVAPVADAAGANAVRQARDMALFDLETEVRGDAGLRWTLLVRAAPVPIGLPVGHGVTQVIPFQEDTLLEQLGAVRGYLTSVGVAGELPAELEKLLWSEGVSRICAAGTMQTPPLDWPNGNTDLFHEMRQLQGGRNE